MCGLAVHFATEEKSNITNNINDWVFPHTHGPIPSFHSLPGRCEQHQRQTNWSAVHLTAHCSDNVCHQLLMASGRARLSTTVRLMQQDTEELVLSLFFLTSNYSFVPGHPETTCSGHVSLLPQSGDSVEHKFKDPMILLQVCRRTCNWTGGTLQRWTQAGMQPIP